MATFNSTSINRLSYPRGVGVYGVIDEGVVVIASNTSFGSAAPDVINLVYIPQNSVMKSFIIGLPAMDGGSGLGFKLVDTVASVSTYISVVTQAQAGGVIAMGQLTVSNTARTGIQALGTNYAATQRNIGSTGSPVQVWSSGSKITLSCITSSTNTTGATALNITYMFEWSPTYDAGV